MTELIRKLTRNNTTLKWEHSQINALNRVKAALSAASAMPYIAPHKETKIIVDESAVGIVGIQVQEDKP